MGRLAVFLGQAGQEYRQMRLGLHRVEAALDRLGNPEKSFASILIAGTNGKGSTARMVESTLRQAGHRSGLYTSPHLIRVQERILVAGAEVSADLLENILDDWSAAGFLDDQGHWTVAKERLTWFEKATVLAFEAFRRSKVEIAVLEVGLGGRMDATNVVDPVASAVTSIGMDHVEVLGASLPEIAREKAGVMRRARPFILGPMAPELSSLFRNWCKEAGARLIEVQAPRGDSKNFTYGDFSGLALALEGRHQLNNAAVALELLSALKEGGFGWSEKNLREGLAALRHPGRLQLLPGKPKLLLDGAHNPQALASLSAYLRESQSREKPVFLLAMMREKDPEIALDCLAPLAKHFVFTELSNPRCLPVEAWRDLAKKRKLHADFSPNSQVALDLARDRAGPEGLVVVTGSLYLVAEILANLDCQAK
jgi:dihydrofolate synthase / folylpolyglutamate synthase